MPVLNIILIALAGALGLALIAGVIGWVVGRGIESMDKLSKEENEQLTPPNLYGVYIASYLLALMLQSAFIDPLDRSLNNPLMAAVWIQCAIGVFRYGTLVKRDEGSPAFRKWAFYFLCASVAALLLSTWMLTIPF